MAKRRKSSEESCDSLEPTKTGERNKEDLIVAVDDQIRLWQPKRKQIGGEEDISAKLKSPKRSEDQQAAQCPSCSQDSEESEDEEEEEGLTKEQFEKSEIYRLLMDDFKKKFG